MQEILDVAQESTAISSKVLTAVVGASIFGLGIIDALVVAPDDTSLPYPIGYTDEVLLLGTGLLLIHQSGAVGELQKYIS